MSHANLRIVILTHRVHSEQYKTKIADLKRREVSQDARLKDLSLFSNREVRDKA